jgi:hypothetical protein
MNARKTMIALAVGSALVGRLALAAPSVTVSNVTANGNYTLSGSWDSATAICVTDTSNLSVSATIKPTYDAPSGPTTINVDTKCKSSPDNWCGTGNSVNKCKRVATTTTVTVNNQSVSATASGSPSSINGSLSGTSPDGGGFSGTFSVSSVSPKDGTQDVTVSASVSDDVTTTTTIITSYWDNTSGNDCAGTGTVISTDGPTAETVHNTGSASTELKKAYILDVVPQTCLL